jgi:energy-coupling factor transport system permease protein
LAAVAEYISRNSPIHRLNPLTKMIWALSILGVGLLFNDYRYLLALLASVLLVAAAAGVLRSLLPAASGLTVFALILLLSQALFYGQGQVLFYLVPVSNRLAVTGPGLLSGIAMAARMMALVLSFLIFLATTRTRDIVLTLVEKLKVPYDYAFMFMTALRFIPAFFSEVRQVSEAQQARAYAVEGWNPVKKIRAYAPVAVPLVLLSLNKADQLAMAMETRGYSGGLRTCLREAKMGVADYGLSVLLALLLVGSAAARLAGYGLM